MSKNKAGSSHKPMTPEAARRIQSSEAKASGGGVPKDSFTARTQRTLATNASPKD
jgi:hypothetical protein